MKNKLFWILVLLVTPSSCVVVETSPFYYPEIQQQIHITIHHENASVTPSEAFRDELSSKPAPTCGVFILPGSDPQPIVPDLASNQYQTLQQIETALASYIKELRAYIISERKRIETAYDQYIRQCRS